MHTTQLLDSGNVAFHNGDFSGDVKFPFEKDERDQFIYDRADGSFVVTLPMEWLEHLVGTKMVDDAIGRLEQMDPLDLVRTK